MSNTERIKELRKEADRLEAADREFDALSEIEKLAITLHDMLCHWNHIDGCSWTYESTKGRHDWTGHAHSAYMQKAIIVKAICDRNHISVDAAIEILKATQ